MCILIFFKPNLAAVLLTFISLNYAQDKWIYITDVKYSANHDHDMISLVSGLKLQVEYDRISWKEVNAWKSGKLCSWLTALKDG